MLPDLSRNLQDSWRITESIARYLKHFNLIFDKTIRHGDGWPKNKLNSLFFVFLAYSSSNNRGAWIFRTMTRRCAKDMNSNVRRKATWQLYCSRSCMCKPLNTLDAKFFSQKPSPGVPKIWFFFGGESFRMIRQHTSDTFYYPSILTSMICRQAEEAERGYSGTLWGEEVWHWWD